MRCSAIVRIKAVPLRSSQVAHGSTKLSFCGAVRLGFGNGGALGQNFTRSPRHVVLKPTPADEFEMPATCEWISHWPPSDRHVGFSFCLLLVVGVVAGAHGGSWALRRLQPSDRGPLLRRCCRALVHVGRRVSCRCDRRRNSSWSSTTELPRPSDSQSQRRCLRGPMR